MSRNACSNKNDKFDEILLTILTNLQNLSFCRNFVKTDDCHEISLRSWTKLYEQIEMTWREGP